MSLDNNKKFAVLDNENVINTIVAESKEIAEQITDKTCIEFTLEAATPGGQYINGVFIPPKPFPSFVLNDRNEWEPPIKHPEDGKAYRWDETQVAWVEILPL